MTIRFLRWMLCVWTVLMLGSAKGIERTAEGYRIPSSNPVFSFPRDHGSHPEFRIEWWYITGHLRDEDGHRFGFQATFFRYALQPGWAPEDVAFGTNQLFMAHMALSDIEQEQFYHEERLNRNGWDAHASVRDMNLSNGNWTLVQGEDERIELSASIRSEVQMALTLEPVQPQVLFGDQGLSKKGADPSACSWYITFPRLEVQGALVVDGKRVQVTGEAWMDHEISSSQLGRDQVGWDWLSVRLHDGTELMVYILRDQSGAPDPYSTLAWIDRDGTVHQVGPDAFSWSSSGRWTSPETGAIYPIDVRLSGKRPDGISFKFEVKPLMRQQELVGSLGGISYWEGACDIFEEGQPVGEAYMELTGYGESLKGSLN